MTKDPRGGQFAYFRSMTDPWAGITVPVDITALLDALHGRPFFLSYLYAVMRQLADGKYEEVYDSLREDVREQTSADAIKTMMETATEGRGSFKKVKDSMVTGVTDADEPHAIAVIGAKYDKKSVVFRIAFDTEMNLIGLDVRGK